MRRIFANTPHYLSRIIQNTPHGIHNPTAALHLAAPRLASADVGCGCIGPGAGAGAAGAGPLAGAAGCHRAGAGQCGTARAVGTRGAGHGCHRGRTTQSGIPSLVGGAPAEFGRCAGRRPACGGPGAGDARRTGQPQRRAGRRPTVPLAVGIVSRGHVGHSAHCGRALARPPGCHADRQRRAGPRSGALRGATLGPGACGDGAFLGMV